MDEITVLWIKYFVKKKKKKKKVKKEKMKILTVAFMLLFILNVQQLHN